MKRRIPLQRTLKPLPFAPIQLHLARFPFLNCVERTRKYAAFALRATYQVNEADIDDGLQAGYLRLWQRLEQQPDLLEDKALAWIGKGMIYTALHATRGDWQFRRQTCSMEEEVAGRPSAGLEGRICSPLMGKPSDGHPHRRASGDWPGRRTYPGREAGQAPRS